MTVEPPPPRPLPTHPRLGAHHDGAGTSFALFSSVADAVELCLFDEAGRETRRSLEAEEEALGMDLVAHGEEAYATGEGAILVEIPEPRTRKERALVEA